MARVDIKMPEDFLLKLSKIEENVDNITEKVLEAGGKVVLEKAKSNLASVIGNDTKYKSRATGTLLNSLGISKPRMDREGNFNIKIGFDEKRPDGKSNAMLASVIEYGKHGQTPKPFMKPAKSASKNSCIEIMKKTLDEEIKKI